MLLGWNKLDWQLNVLFLCRDQITHVEYAFQNCLLALQEVQFAVHKRCGGGRQGLIFERC